jgi:RNA polymerase subunit RPABC4/transcription elongation factor Spt4
MSDKKNCPFCGEEILAAAKKCKHCHEFLTPGQGGDPKKGNGDPSLGGQMNQVAGCFLIPIATIIVIYLVTRLL